MNPRPDLSHNAFSDNNFRRFGKTPSDGLSGFIDQLDMKSGKILEISAGEGRNALYLSEAGFEVLAIDESELAISQLKKQAAERNLKISTVVADFLNANIGCEQFDLIITIASLCAFRGECLNSIRDKIIKALKPGGYLYAVVFTTEDPGYKQQEPSLMSEYSTYIQHYFEPDELKNLFNSLHIINYKEYLKPDHTHGQPHIHGKAKLIAQK